jgi:hypothetical protein
MHPSGQNCQSGWTKYGSVCTVRSSLLMGDHKSTYYYRIPLRFRYRRDSRRHHSKGDTQRNGYRKWIGSWTLLVSILATMHESGMSRSACHPKSSILVQTRCRTDVPWSDIRPHKYFLLVYVWQRPGTKVACSSKNNAWMLTNTIKTTAAQQQPCWAQHDKAKCNYIVCISIVFMYRFTHQIRTTMLLHVKGVLFWKGKGLDCTSDQTQTHHSLSKWNSKCSAHHSVQ